MHKQLMKSQIQITQWWSYIEDKPKHLVKQVIEEDMKVQDRLKQYLNGYHYTTKIRKYISQFLYSDRHAYEVIEVKTPKTIVVRRLDAHNKSYLGQDWEFKSNTENEKQTIRLSSKGWGKGKWLMMDEPYEHYDWTY